MLEEAPIRIENARKRALREIQESIIAQRGSLEGLLVGFLAERHEEAGRELLESAPAGSQLEKINHAE